MSLRARSRGSLRTLPDDVAAQKPPRDIKRSFLIFGLGALSWVATYVGMLELIEANMGDLPLVHRIIIGFSVAMLMTMIIWLLDQMFRPQPLLTRLFYAGGYVFLSLISIGFGFGFYWKVLESRGEASRSAESAVSQVQNALHGASTRLEQLQGTLVQLTQVSNEKAELERTKGTSCPNSKPGDGPRRKMREDDAQRFSFASEFVKGRVGSVKGDMAALDGDLAKIGSADASTFDPKTGTRNEFMRALSRKLDLTVTGFNAFRTDPQLRQLRSDLADRAERTTLADGRGGSIACPDPQLQTALHGVVKAIDQLPELSKPEIAAVEGSEATIEAFRRLTATFYGALSFKLPPSADELRELQKKAVQSVENPDSAEMRAMRASQAQEAGLSKRDYVPLAVAVFVDLCLLLVSMVQRAPDRLGGLMPKMQAAERGPVIQILSRFNEIHRDKQIRENFEIFRHVVFDMNGDYYVAVPLDAPPRMNPREREALRVEALLLANLFASFEKEKIFKRTMLPVTGSVRKRLARQGSKFAGSEAFRVYKFTDGAWSDIILGAVMGAARRIEAQSSAAANANEPVLPDHPDALRESTAAPASVLATGPTARAGEPTAGARAETDHAFSAETPEEPSHAATREARTATTLAIDPEHAARFGPYATRFKPGQRMEPRLARTPHAPRVAWPAPPPLADVSMGRGDEAGARDVPREPGADAARESAREPLRVVALARAGAVRAGNAADQTNAPADDARASITVSRETATFHLPAGENGLPPSLKSALERLDNAAMLHSAENEVPGIEEANSPLADLAQDALSPADRALIGRMAPPAAE